MRRVSSARQWQQRNVRGLSVLDTRVLLIVDQSCLNRGHPVAEYDSSLLNSNGLQSSAMKGILTHQMFFCMRFQYGLTP
jgi:hypothetical protein